MQNLSPDSNYKTKSFKEIYTKHKINVQVNLSGMFLKL